MNKLTGKKLIESFVAGKCPVFQPVTTEGETFVETTGKIRLPVPAVENSRKDVSVPENMLLLPIDERGYRVPFFVSWIDGKPDFRCVRPGALRECVREKLCWVCGRKHVHDPDGTYV